MAGWFGPVGRPPRLALVFGACVALAFTVAVLAGAQLPGGAAGQSAPITVTKTASPASRPEPGGSFSFTVTVTVTGLTATLVSLTDDVYGDLATRGSCTTAIGTQFVPGDFSTYTCGFDASFNGNARAAQTSTTTAVVEVTVIGPGGTTVFAQSVSGQTTIAITDVPPTVSVAHSANPSSLPAPGGNFNYTTVVTNTSREDVTITALVDDIYGNLSNRGSCTSAVGTVLAPNATFTCSFVGTFRDAAGTSLLDQVAVTVTDDDGTTATARAIATVGIAVGTTTTSSTSTSSTSTSTSTTLPPDSSTSSTAGNGAGVTTTIVGLSVLTGPSTEPGGEIRVRGAGCTGDSPVVLRIGTTTVGVSRAGPDGSFSADLVAPDVPPGRIELIADCGPLLSATIDLVVASQVDTGASTLAVFLFFVLLSLVLFRRRRIVLPVPRNRSGAVD